MKSLSRVRLFAIPLTVAYQSPQSMEFSRQEYWSGLPFPSPGDLPDPRIEPRSTALQADALPSEPPGIKSQECKYKVQVQNTAELHLDVWDLPIPVIRPVPSALAVRFVSTGPPGKSSPGFFHQPKVPPGCHWSPILPTTFPGSVSSPGPSAAHGHGITFTLQARS